MNSDHRYTAPKKDTFRFRAAVWLYPGTHAAWHFLTVPEKISVMIKRSFGARAKGWGSLPAAITIGKTSWKTSLFPDKKRRAYILPLKADVRKKEKLVSGDHKTVQVRILV